MAQATRGTRLTRAVAQVQSLLPLLLVGALAGYTWWLVQATPDTESRPAAALPEGAPDYEMLRATVERFDAQGRLVSAMSGQSMQHFVAGDRLLVRGLHLASLDSRGQALQAQAAQGLYLGTTEVVTLQGQVRVSLSPPDQAGVARAPKATPPAALRPGSITFEGEAMTLDTRAQRLSSDRPARLLGDQGVVSANSLRHDARTGLSELKGKVRGQLSAAKGAP